MPARNPKVMVRGLICLGVLSLLLLTACNEQTKPRDFIYAEPISSFLPGTYIMELSINDISLENLTYRPYLKDFVGQWVLNLNDSGSFEVNHDNFLFEGRYILSSDDLIFEDTSWLHNCFYSKNENELAYKWSISGKELALISLEDDCFDRSLILTAHPWVPI
jgi:hypothetical protein